MMIYRVILSIYLLGSLFLGFGALQAQSIEGVWKTIDEESGAEKSHVQFYKTKSGKYAGKVVKILEKGQEDALCEKCPGDKKNQPVLNMVIAQGLEQQGKEWKNGRILDPEKGKEYNCKVWLEDEKTLKVRGYWGPVYRTQTWYKVL